MGIKLNVGIHAIQKVRISNDSVKNNNDFIYPVQKWNDMFIFGGLIEIISLMLFQTLLAIGKNYFNASYYDEE